MAKRGQFYPVRSAAAEIWDPTPAKKRNVFSVAQDSSDPYLSGSYGEFSGGTINANASSPPMVNHYAAIDYDDTVDSGEPSRSTSTTSGVYGGGNVRISRSDFIDSSSAISVENTVLCAITIALVWVAVRRLRRRRLLALSASADGLTE